MSREVRFGLVLTPLEKRALVQLSEAEGGLSQAATVRQLIRMEAKRCGLWPIQKAEGYGEAMDLTDHERNGALRHGMER